MKIRQLLKRRKGVLLLLLFAAVGGMLVIFGGAASSEKEIDRQYSYYEEKKQLEQEVCRLLEQMNGVSDVSVLITMECSDESVFPTGQGTLFADTSSTSSRTDYARIRGVAVVCRGGERAAVQAEIISLLSALFDLPTNHIYVSGGG